MERSAVAPTSTPRRSFAPRRSAAPPRQPNDGLPLPGGAEEAEKGQAKAACDPPPAQDPDPIVAKLRAAGPDAIRRDARG